jgi:hypothetical protein
VLRRLLEPKFAAAIGVEDHPIDIPASDRGRLPVPVSDRRRLGGRPARPSSAIRAATVFGEIFQPASRKSSVMRGLP